MNTNFVVTENVKTFTSALNRIAARSSSSNRLMLLEGEYGLGKSEAGRQFAINSPKAIYLRAKALTTPRWILEDLVKELGEQPLYHASKLFGQARMQLESNPRTVIVDEADYLLHDMRCIETLRDLHDTTGAAFVIIGMGLLSNKIARHRHFCDRLAQVVKFHDLPLGDVRQVIASNCGVKLTDDAVKFIHRTSGGRFRQVKEWMEKAEQLAAVNSLKEISAANLEGRTK
jgi:DNA transposition AAA+ family ATPase